MFDPARLVFIDETCTNTAMVRLRGRAPRGERLVDYAPHGAWKTVTFVGALRQRGMTAPFVIEGAMNGPMFLAYVRHGLVPTLKRGETVLMDNLPVYKVAGVAEAIQAAGAVLIYLPKYSPDLNPIELAFSKLKAHLRKAAWARHLRGASSRRLLLPLLPARSPMAFICERREGQPRKRQKQFTGTGKLFYGVGEPLVFLTTTGITISATSSPSSWARTRSNKAPRPASDSRRIGTA